MARGYRREVPRDDAERGAPNPPIRVRRGRAPEGHQERRRAVAAIAVVAAVSAAEPERAPSAAIAVPAEARTGGGGVVVDALRDESNDRPRRRRAPSRRLFRLVHERVRRAFPGATRRRSFPNDVWRDGCVLRRGGREVRARVAFSRPEPGRPDRGLVREPLQRHRGRDAALPGDAGDRPRDRARGVPADAAAFVPRHRPGRLPRAAFR
mmetsp:Transcript_15921/g.67114  ORF Transcript_15921/g.67114 Transcript_15921/m.67114 type:complete len:209 (+) Transcript_15921:182-808(+)